MEIQRQFNVKAVSALFPSKFKQQIVKGTHNYLPKELKTQIMFAEKSKLSLTSPRI